MLIRSQEHLRNFGEDTTKYFPPSSSTDGNDDELVLSDNDEVAPPSYNEVPHLPRATADLSTATTGPSPGSNGLAESTLNLACVIRLNPLFQFIKKHFRLRNPLNSYATTNVDDVAAALLQAKSGFDEKWYYQLRRRKGPRRPGVAQKKRTNRPLLQRELKALLPDSRKYLAKPDLRAKA
ncbi:hypothetical protein TWF718_009700 [Orbilia javanica]|uniref:Uncharacterized protein n=1 Tax=Orbilia javanica TaxID=47235 RepID=A0AAN8RBN5_9PEZI